MAETLSTLTEYQRGFAQTSVYPREVVKEALRHNAAAVIFYHNHPSGAAEPSSADEFLTRNLKDALAIFADLVDVASRIERAFPGVLNR